MRLLIIEDERTLCDAVSKSLEKDGFEVDVCYTGAEALEKTGADKYDLIILDLNLPSMDGMDILKKLRLNDQETKVLILSARSEVADKVEGLDAGANDYLAKPLKYESLLEILKKYDNLIDKSIENDFIEAKVENEQELSMILDLIKGDLGIETEDAKDLLSDFGTELSNQIQDLITSIMKNDLELSAEIAHSIKGAAGNLRINKIYDISKEIEVCAKEHDNTAIQRLITEMKTYWRGLGV
mgnify:CR=1 FL=1